jgi:hypothetical protein
MQAKHIKGTVSLCAALIAGVALFAASGAGAAKPRAVTKIDVSTKAAVVHYLRSIHVNPKGVVIQRGARNYAGPNCPGKRWTCASTKHTVVQIAKRGGQNRFVCKSSKCVVVQISGTSHGVYVSGRRLASTAAPNKGGGNSGVCLKNGSGSPTGTGQTCTIIQSGSGPNTAVVWENSQKVAGLTTSLTFTATITQTATGTSQGNTACVTQNINLDGSTTGTKGKPVTAALEAHQSVTIQQDSYSGPNTAATAAVLSGTTAICDPNSTNLLGQNQTLTSTINGTAKITQNENAVDGSPNVALDIKQNQSDGFKGSASGVNKASFNQTNTLTAIANGPSGVQVQSSPTEGGILAAVNQDSKGLSTAIANQTEEQCEDASTSGGLTACDHNADSSAAGFTQTQYGPAGLAKTASGRHGRHFNLLRKNPGDSLQTGNDQDKFTVTQTSHQWNDSGSHQSNVIAGGITTDGTGTVTQNTLIQNTPKKNVHQGDDTTVTGNMNCPTGASSCTKNLSPPTITGTPDDPSAYGDDASFSFSNVDDTVVFVCSLDGSAFTSCTSSQDYGTGLASGSHTFEVKTEDPDNGNLSAASPFTWVITPPDPTITASSEPTNPDFFGTSDTFAFTDADSSVHYKCTLDGGTATACNAGSITYTSAVLSPGLHTFSVTAYDQKDIYPSDNPATYSWTVLPLEVSALGGDGSSAGWACQPGGPIALTVGTDTSNTYAQVLLDDAVGVVITGLLSEPTFTTDKYAAGSPRWDIFLSNGDFLFGYPPNSGLNGSNFGWTIYDSNNNSDGLFHPWSYVQAAESGMTVTEAEVIADGDQSASTTDSIGNLQFNGTTFNSGACS